MRDAGSVMRDAGSVMRDAGSGSYLVSRISYLVYRISYLVSGRVGAADQLRYDSLLERDRPLEQIPLPEMGAHPEQQV